MVGRINIHPVLIYFLTLLHHWLLLLLVILLQVYEFFGMLV